MHLSSYTFTFALYYCIFKRVNVDVIVVIQLMLHFMKDTYDAETKCVYNIAINIVHGVLYILTSFIHKHHNKSMIVVVTNTIQQ